MFEKHQLIGHNGIEHNHIGGTVGCGAYRPKLKLIARKSKGRGAVAVGIVEQKRWNFADARFEVEVVSFIEFDRSFFLQLFKYFAQLLANKHRNNGRRRFVGTEAVFVACRHNAGAEQISVVVYRFDGIHKEGQEAEVVFGLAAGGEQVDARICTQRPVVVLAAAIDACEGFFVEEHLELMLFGYFFHHFHQQQVVVYGQVTFFKSRSTFKLAGCYFIVAGTNGNAQLQTFYFKVHHKSTHTRRNRAKVVVFELLAFGRCMAKEASSGSY